MLNKVSNLLMLLQIVMVNALAVAVGAGIYPQSKAVAIILFATMILLFCLKEWKFFKLSSIWPSGLKKELRCTPVIDLSFIIIFTYYYGFKNLSFFVVPIVLFFAIDLIRHRIERKE